MDENLISKKDLLQETNISYGQLYRWKRKNIIPEEWFIKKSTFTGQETFFPKDKILARIELILSMKDDASLDDIANMFANKKGIDKEFDINLLLNKGIISTHTKNIFNELYNNQEIATNKELLIINIIEEYMLKGIITIDELKNINEVINDNFDKLFKDGGSIILFRKLGIPFVIGCLDKDNIVVDKNFIKVVDIDLIECVSNIKKKII